MLYFIYKKEDISIEKKLIGCLAVTEKEGKIENSKFNFQVIDQEMELPTEWTWAFGEKGIHLWDSNLEDAPDIIYEVVENSLNKFFQEELDKEILNSNKDNDILSLTGKDIIDNLKKIKGEELSELDKQIAFSMALIKIASYLDNNPSYMEEFPLYNAYIKKHNLSEEQYSVEEFVEDILTAAQAGM